MGVAFAPIAVGAASKPDAEANLGIHQTGEYEVGLLAIILRHREIVVLHAGEFTEGALEGMKASE
jgi:hypothetical protein